MTQAFFPLAVAAVATLAASPAFAQTAKIDAAGLVLMMTIPGLALFYAARAAVSSAAMASSTLPAAPWCISTPALPD